MPPRECVSRGIIKYPLSLPTFIILPLLNGECHEKVHASVTAPMPVCQPAPTVTSLTALWRQTMSDFWTYAQDKAWHRRTGTLSIIASCPLGNPSLPVWITHSPFDLRFWLVSSRRHPSMGSEKGGRAQSEYSSPQLPFCKTDGSD